MSPVAPAIVAQSEATSPIPVKIPAAMIEFDAGFRDRRSNYGRSAIHDNLPPK